MSGTGANLPINITITGAPQAEAAFNAVSASGTRAMTRVQQSADAAGTSTGRLGTVMGQAGFQIQDFATQVSMGQNALTAFATQGSQLLGVFGTGGAIAGAVLTIGVLAANLLSVKDATDAAAEAQDRLDRALQRSTEFFETTAEAAKRTAREIRAVLALSFSSEAQRATTALAGEERALALLQGDRTRLIDSNRNLPGFNPDTVLRGPIAERQAEIERLRAVIRENEAERERALTAPSGAEREAQDRAEAGGGKGGRGGGAAARTREFLDVNEALGRSLDEIQGRLDAYNTAIGESESGLTGAAAATAQYESRLQTLRDAVDAGLISEEEFQSGVERTTAALDRQMGEIERRANRSSDIGRELGLSFSSAFEDAIVKGAELSDVLKGIEQDIARIIIRKAVTEPLGNAASDFAKSIDWSSIATSIFGARAEGGPVTGGMPYLVGERGPEIMVPNGSGTVIPNHAMGGVNFSPTYNIDARGADPSMMPRLRAEMAQIAAASIADLKNQVSRGGSAARTFGRR
jgi:hypothetical protein